MSGIVRASRSLLRPILLHSKTKSNNVTQPIIPKRTQITYREEMVALNSSGAKLATFISFLTTLWVGIYGYYHTDLITGHNPDIDPTKWTDEELGIPPDDEDVYPEGYQPRV